MEEIITFKIKLEKSVKCIIKCKSSENLQNLRKNISLKISSSNFLFILDDEPIEEEDENGFSIDDIAKEKIVKIINNNKKKGVIPIQGSVEKSRMDDIIIYSYPKYILTEIEKADEINTKNILLIGKSGDGKTTFLNALINVLTNIKGDDKIRYKLIFEDYKKEQDQSQTDKINIYNVKIENKKILRLIDSPGFIDTKGKEKDEEYIENFKNFFRNEIFYLNCICFVINCASYRLNETQKELYDKVSSLFSEEIKNNFVFIFTHYTSSGDMDAKVSLKKYDVFKDIINANNIFKLDNAWAFSGDKNIKNYMWEKTSGEIKRLINDKFVKLNPVKTAQSAEIIEKRKEYH